MENKTNQTDNGERNPLSIMLGVGTILLVIGGIFGWGALATIGGVVALIPLCVAIWNKFC